MLEYPHYIFPFYVGAPVHSLICVKVAASSILFIARDDPTFPEFDSKHVHNGHPSPLTFLALYS